MPLRVSKSPSPKAEVVLRPLTEEDLNNGPVLVTDSDGRNVYLATRAARVHEDAKLRPWQPGDAIYADITVLDMSIRDVGRTYFGQAIGHYRVLPAGREVTVTLSNVN